MSRRIAVKDSNIFIDMECMGILDLWFQLGYETITSNLVILELKRGGHRQTMAYVESGQIQQRTSPLAMLIQYQAQYVGISAADAAVLHLAVEHKALLLSGDGKLRQSAEIRRSPHHPARVPESPSPKQEKTRRAGLGACPFSQPKPDIVPHGRLHGDL